MDTPLIVAILSAAAAIVVPAISFYLTKSKERQAAGVMMLRRTSAKNPLAWTGSRLTNGRITNAVSFEVPAPSVSVTVPMVIGSLPLSPPPIAPLSGAPETMPRYWQFSRKILANSSCVSDSSPNSFLGRAYRPTNFIAIPRIAAVVFLDGSRNVQGLL